jgi:hypothetical protein
LTKGLNIGIDGKYGKSQDEARTNYSQLMDL